MPASRREAVHGRYLDIRPIRHQLLLPRRYPSTYHLLANLCFLITIRIKPLVHRRALRSRLKGFSKLGIEHWEVVLGAAARFSVSVGICVCAGFHKEDGLQGALLILHLFGEREPPFCKNDSITHIYNRKKSRYLVSLKT
jgi:hypothetical protein